jgi:hypothetical protein
MNSFVTLVLYLNLFFNGGVFFKNDKKKHGRNCECGVTFTIYFIENKFALISIYTGHLRWTYRTCG